MAGAGGSGQTLDADVVINSLKDDPSLRIVLAGGLDPENVQGQVDKLGAFKSRLMGVDVSSGVETDGEQDLEKIKAFVKAAKALR